MEMIVLSSPDILSDIRISWNGEEFVIVLNWALLPNNHVSRICQPEYFQLLSFRTVQNVLLPKALERLQYKLITSHLDYCNSHHV